MGRQIAFLLFSLGITLASGVVWAGPAEVIQAGISRAGLGAQVEGIVPSPMPGLYQVNLKGGRILYASENGNFFIQGYLYEAQQGKTLNLTEIEERKGVLATLAQLSPKDMVVFSAPVEKTYITVFTDTECPYCHKLHEDMAELNAGGVTVRYLAYPRHGMGSEGARALERVWCAEDRLDAMNAAVEGRKVEAEECAAPVARQFELGVQIGVQGTPTIILADGQILTGYQGGEILLKAALAAAQ